jgi:hypothetical protein
MKNRIKEFCSANRNYIDTIELHHYLIDEFGEDCLTDFGVEEREEEDLIFVSFRIETKEECFDVDLTIEENEDEELEIVDYSII